MLSNDRMENIKTLIDIVKGYFNENALGFEVTPYDNGEDFLIECIIYRSFLVSFSLADIPKGGVLNMNIAIGGKMVGLYLVIENTEKLSLSFTKESIIKNLDILNDYLIWRMTDSQKKTFNIGT